ncbi:hypothetical protein T310_8716, partial [Rasamsonia emersonii CBS 393.64]
IGLLLPPNNTTQPTTLANLSRRPNPQTGHQRPQLPRARIPFNDSDITRYLIADSDEVAGDVDGEGARCLAEGGRERAERQFASFVGYCQRGHRVAVFL